MSHSFHTHTGTRSRMPAQEHHSLLQSWQSSDKSSLFVSLHGFCLINNLGSLVISTVFRTPTDLSPIFCQTCVNIYCCDSMLLSAVIVNLPSYCLLTDEDDPWPGGARGRGRGWHLYVVCVVCLWVAASRATRLAIFPTQSLCQALSCLFTLSTP